MLKFFKPSSNYMRVKVSGCIIYIKYQKCHILIKRLNFQEKMEKAANEKSEAQRKLRGKSHKLSLTPATSHSLIPSRWHAAHVSADRHVLEEKRKENKNNSNNLSKMRYQRNKSVPRDFIIRNMKENFWRFLVTKRSFVDTCFVSYSPFL